jgi:hypothetical protein
MKVCPKKKRYRAILADQGRVSKNWGVAVKNLRVRIVGFEREGERRGEMIVGLNGREGMAREVGGLRLGSQGADLGERKLWREEFEVSGNRVEKLDFMN